MKNISIANTDAPRSGSGEVLLPPLIPGILIRRYKRFLADAALENGETVTAHCPNPGRMLECCEPGRKVFLSRHDAPTRKLAYTWQLIEMPGSVVGVNSVLANRIVAEALKAGKIKELDGYDHVRREYDTGGHSRLDFLLTKENKKPCMVEVKNCTFVKDGAAQFPDAVTSRGLKHLRELDRLVKSGARGVTLYVIQRTDARIFKPADAVDPAYGETLRSVVKNGVEILVYDVKIDLKRVVLNKRIDYLLS